MSGDKNMGLMEGINDFLKTTKGKIVGAVVGAGIGIMTAVSPVSADQLYDYNKSDYVAEQYMEENFPDYVRRDVFRTLHELMSGSDSDPERFVEEEDVEYYLDRYSEMADRHGDYDNELDSDERKNTSRRMSKVLPYFADFWMGDMDGRPEECEMKQFKKGLKQHESLIAADYIADRFYGCDYSLENMVEEEAVNYAENHIRSEKERKVFYSTKLLFDRFEDYDFDETGGEEDAKEYVRERFRDMAGEIDRDISGEDVSENDMEDLADIYAQIKPELVDYLAGDGDGVREYWETRRYRDLEDENIAVGMVESFMDLYGE